VIEWHRLFTWATLSGAIQLATAGTRTQGYKNRPNFLKFGENRQNRVGPNSKTAEFIVHCFKISEKDKSQ
jgi:hypothetical protein